MGLVDLFRPKWKHSNADVRVKALRSLGVDQRDIVVDAARHDADDGVRRVAVELLDDPDVLSSIAGDGSSEIGSLAAARAAALWTKRAVSAKNEGQVAQALDHIRDAKGLAHVVVDAKTALVRRAALQRLTDNKVLAGLAREATDPEVRRMSLDAISDPEVLRGIATGGEPRDVALAAIDRLDEPAALEQVIKHAQRKSLRNRAKRRLTALAPEEAPAPAGPSEAQLRYAEQLRVLALVETVMMAREFDRADEMARAVATWDRIQDKDTELCERFANATERFAREHDDNVAQRAQAELDQAAATQREREATVRRERAAAAQRKREAERAAAPVPAAQPEPEPEPEVTPEQRQRQALANAERLDAACADLERTATGTDLRAAQNLLRRSADLFDQALPLPSPETRDAVHARYQAARTQLYAAVQTLEEHEKWREWANLTKQKTLAEQAQALAATMDDEPQLATKLKTLQDEWKSVRSVGAGKGEALWEKFRTACDRIYDKIKAEHAANLEHREALCQRAEAWKDSTDWRGTATALKDLQAVWKTLGPVSRADDARTWDRFRGACDEFFARRDAANAALEQTYEKNAAKKEAMIDKVLALSEGIVDEPTLERAKTEVKRIQAAWRDVGHAPRQAADGLHQRFRAACDGVFGKLDALEREQAQAEAARVAAEREEVRARLADSEADPKTLVELWPRVHGLGDPALRQACYDACRAALEALPAVFAGTDLAPVNALRRKRKLCERLEALAPTPPTELALADQIKEALAHNALASPHQADDERTKAVDAAKLAWLRIGPTPSEAGAELDARFEAAVAAALAPETAR